MLRIKLFARIYAHIRARIRAFTRWLVPGIGVKRWIGLALGGMIIFAVGFAYLAFTFLDQELLATRSAPPLTYVLILLFMGVFCVGIAFYALLRTLLAPYRRSRIGPLADIVYSHNVRRKGRKFVAIGGGTGLPSILRAMKAETGNITAIVTVADDGGSSGRLRREMGVLPPGDFRNNIVALADDESLMAKLFQYRFTEGNLEGHAFGNLFIAALSGVAGGLDNALIETARVLNIQGRVLPSTLEDVHLMATLRQPGKTRTFKIQGESRIGESRGQIETIGLVPEDAVAYAESVQAILEADIVTIGPGSLYTSILPNLMVKGIADALRATSAYKVYICNVATQPGETEDYTVADHVLALEKHIGRGVFQGVLANNAQPVLNAGANTIYVQPVSEHHEIAQRYEVFYSDLTDPERPWRHDPVKLAQAIMMMRDREGLGGKQLSLSP